MSNFQVLIIEDDFRVAAINRQFVEDLEGFNVVDVCKTGDEALQFLKMTEHLPDLILLDVFIPDVIGLELLWTIRTDYKEIDIIMMTAAKEVETVQEAMRAGIFDYMIKPLDRVRVHDSLNRFRKKQKLLMQKKEFTQTEIDQLRERASIPIEPDYEELPKGIDRYTLEKVVAVLTSHIEEGVTAVEGAKQIGASRSTVRRYLEYLISTGHAHAEMKYGDVGRPERRYFPL
ncbi:response regulator [Halalkalibacter urbisdiaboli]|uniref:response regulator n=1 Tax=Halalkalibacter urbisdiaboli TaxID=1960589 RepID=UPI000B43111F|nr:response regulator [Halalkalibacter urbisdiaboli]